MSLLAPHHGGETYGIDVERRNYVTVTIYTHAVSYATL